MERTWERARLMLYERRITRERPLRDEKILTDWNGLMIAALARAAAVLGDPAYLQAAREAADFVLQNLRIDSGDLLHRYYDTTAGITAHAQDYAFFVWGLLELYQAGFDDRCLGHAVELGRDLIDRYWDEEGGGFFTTADDGEKLLVRQKDTFDGAIPSANSVASLVMLELGRITADRRFEEVADRLIQITAGQASDHPGAFSFFLTALDFAAGPSKEIVLVGDDVAEMQRAVFDIFLPNRVVIHRPAGDADIVALAPYLADYTPIDGRATAYVCVNYACSLPTTDIATLRELLLN